MSGPSRLAGFVAAGFAMTNHHRALVAALVRGLGRITVLAAGLGAVFPVVPDRLPLQLLVLEAIAPGSAGVNVVISIQGMRL
ncbi:hypothetical protein PUR34_15040 [Streptomyces sp. JV185]|uniref:hypothetical protein n=1 Tax=Streptomyces sp. JV185 TaxID=858638 RepID=UPI002E7A4380|nr:hypothetical protein [Streptomyces sp. JV185]MEE1769426.1 hypothetical protein [Streptomyces sp. JV185]